MCSRPLGSTSHHRRRDSTNSPSSASSYSSSPEMNMLNVSKRDNNNGRSICKTVWMIVFAVLMVIILQETVLKFHLERRDYVFPSRFSFDSNSSLPSAMQQTVDDRDDNHTDQKEVETTDNLPQVPASTDGNESLDINLSHEQSNLQAAQHAEEHAVYEFKPIPSVIPQVRRGITNGNAAGNSGNSNSAFFAVVSDLRSGTDWLLHTLDSHNHICASKSFPTAMLLPSTMPWIPDDSLEKGCTLAFVRESVQQLLIDAPDDVKDYAPPRCRPPYSPDDALLTHLPRLCYFIQELRGDFRVEAMTRLFVDAFVHDDHEQKFTACSCPSASRVRGVKIMSDWLPQSEKLVLDDTAVHGAKIVRLQRRNYFERYMSFTVALHTGQWSIHTYSDKQAQLAAFAEKKFEVDVDNMLYMFGVMRDQDDFTNSWVEKHGGDILWVDYEDLRANPVAELATIYQFLGVSEDDSSVISVDQLLSDFNGKYVLDLVANKAEVLEALGAYGFSDFVGGRGYWPVQHILYDSARVRNTEAYEGLRFLAFGEGRLPIEPSARFGPATVNALQQMPDDTIVVLSDNLRNPGGGLPLNPHVRSMSQFYKKLATARTALSNLTGRRSGAVVVVSASSECCDGTDATDDIKEKWITFQKDLASERGANDTEYVFLDGSFMAGKAVDMLRVIKDMNVDPKENGRAALLSYFQIHPDSIVVDYGRIVFGERFDGVPSKGASCNSKGISDSTLFVHPSPQDWGCHNTQKHNFRPYPHWEDTGIKVQPILDHVERFAVEDISMSGIDRYFGKEIFYIVDRDGIQRTLGGKRDKYRVKPTEKFLTQVHKELMLTGQHSASNRWSILQRTLKSNGFMYFSWYGDWKNCQSGEDNLVPLFTTCASAGCSHSFPMPNYMTIIESQPDTRHWYDVFARFDNDYPWDKKKRKVVWRGGLSENDPTKVFDSPRWRLCKLVHELIDESQKEMFDVGLTNIPEFLTSQIDIDASLVGGLVPGISSMLDFQGYVAVLDMDGNSWSSRFSTLLCFNQVTIKVQPFYQDYFWHNLVPWKHYIPVKHDLSDLVETISFVVDPKNDELMKEIAASANQWCAERLAPAELARDMLDMLESYAQLLDRANPNWEETWAMKKNELLLSDSKVAFMKLDENEDTSVEDGD